MSPKAESFIAFVRSRLAQSSLKSLGQVSGNVLGQWFDEWDAAMQAAKPKKKRGAPKVSSDPETMIAEFSADPANRGKDVRKAYNEMMFYWRNQGICPTRRHFINWLLKTPATLQPLPEYRPQAQTGLESQGNLVPEPAGWRELLADDAEESVFIRSDWASIPNFYQRRVSRKCAALPTPEPLGNLFKFPNSA